MTDATKDNETTPSAPEASEPVRMPRMFKKWDEVTPIRSVGGLAIGGVYDVLKAYGRKIDITDDIDDPASPINTFDAADFDHRQFHIKKGDSVRAIRPVDRIAADQTYTVARVHRFKVFFALPGSDPSQLDAFDANDFEVVQEPDSPVEESTQPDVDRTP